MTTITSRVLSRREITAAPPPSWLAACAVAMVGVLVAPLAGPSGMDPAKVPRSNLLDHDDT